MQKLIDGCSSTLLCAHDYGLVLLIMMHDKATLTLSVGICVLTCAKTSRQWFCIVARVHQVSSILNLLQQNDM
jgi:hypothetical protein